MAANPYTVERFELGLTRGGDMLALAPMTAAAAADLGPRCAAIGPWAHYGIAGESLAAGLARESEGLMTYQVLVGTAQAGAVIIRYPWLLGPYLAMLAVLPAFQGQQIGATVLSWYEARAREAEIRNIWLCVSGFNVDAQRFYQAHGFQQVGLIPDMMAAGEDELLMRKLLQK
jgi:diamine N-acetyltransferase